jgi:hypothetical protein
MELSIRCELVSSGRTAGFDAICQAASDCLSASAAERLSLKVLRQVATDIGLIAEADGGGPTRRKHQWTTLQILVLVPRARGEGSRRCCQSYANRSPLGIARAVVA